MEKVILITTKSELKELFAELLGLQNSSEAEFSNDKLLRTEAAQFVGVSVPTLKKMIDVGIIKEHGLGRKKFFLKSEIIKGLTQQADSKI